MKQGTLRPVSQDSLAFWGKCDSCLEYKELHKHNTHWMCLPCIDKATVGWGEEDEQK